MAIDDGGPAFPLLVMDKFYKGMSLRDWLAGEMQEDDRLVKCIRAMDDQALFVFALYPDSEREEWLTETVDEEGRSIRWPVEQVDRIVLRLRLEAKAIARVRYMQADAMIAEKQRREAGE